MKDLSQYPTPETDSVSFLIQWTPDTNSTPRELVDADDMRDLERRLAACREFIRNAIDYSHLEEMHKQPAEELLAATAPKL